MRPTARGDIMRGMGWLFVMLGLLTGAIGAFMVYYGQDMVRRPPEQPHATMERPTLAPEQERMLELLAKYQKLFVVNKLIVSRKMGTLFFGKESEKAKDISLIRDLYGVSGEDVARASQFEKLLESMPPEYIRFYSESRFDNPFVVSVTESGMRYLRTD